MGYVVLKIDLEGTLSHVTCPKFWGSFNYGLHHIIILCKFCGAMRLQRNPSQAGEYIEETLFHHTSLCYARKGYLTL